MDVLLPAVGADALQGAKVLSSWLEALDQWQYKEGNLTPVLCFASRVWALHHSLDLGIGTAAKAEQLQRLLTAAFPALRGTGAPLAQIHAVIESQATLAGKDVKEWILWPAPLQQEALRLMKWRELQGEVPFGQAARCYAALREATHGPVKQGPPTQPGHAKVESLGSWRFGQCMLVHSRADVYAAEFALIGASVRRVTEAAETPVACLTVLARLLGHDAHALDLSAEVPISNGGIPLKDWQRLCRRVGLKAEEYPWQIPHRDVGARPVFLRLQDGSCLLLLDVGESWCRAYVPGLDFPFRWLRTDQLALEQVAFSCVVSVGSSGWEAKTRPWRTPKLNVLSSLSYEFGFANAQAFWELYPEVARWPFTSQLPPVLPELSIAGLVEAHRSLGVEGSPFHGVFRRVNLHGTGPMVVWQQVPQAMGELFRHIAAMPPERHAPFAVERVVAVFMDFLAVHPFINGNRRMAMALAAALFRRYGFLLDLSALSRIEIYYVVRCAVAGHPKPLMSAFARCLDCESPRIS